MNFWQSGGARPTFIPFVPVSFNKSLQRVAFISVCLAELIFLSKWILFLLKFSVKFP